MRTITAACLAICSIVLISHATARTAEAQHLESYVASGAGDPTYNGNYFPNGTTSAGFLRWTNGTRYMIFLEPHCILGNMFVLTADPQELCNDNFGYYIVHSSEPPPSEGWDWWNADGPAPIVEVLTLPVEVVDLTATASGSNAMLNWRTIGASSNTNYEVQQQTGDGYSTIGTVEGGSDESQTYRYHVPNLAAGAHAFRLRLVGSNGAASYSEVIEITIAAPERFALQPAYPNPFESTTTMTFDVPNSGEVHLAVYNLLGQNVSVLRDGYVTAGTHSATLRADDLPSGLYFVRLETANSVFVRRLVLQR